MVNKNIYNTISEKGLLKSLGPFRIIESDKSISGVREPQKQFNSPTVIGESIIYGAKVIGEKLEIKPK